MAEAAWHPDPTGRHELRYFDGANWTDHVSDAGAQGTDPVTPAVQQESEYQPTPIADSQPMAANPPAADQSTWAMPGTDGGTVTSSETVSGGGGSKLPWIVGACVAAAVVIGLVLFIGGDDAGTGSSEKEVAVGEVVVHKVTLESGQPFRFRVVPLDPGMDLALAIGLTDDDARRGIVDLTKRLEGGELFSETPMFSDPPRSPDDVSSDLLSDMLGSETIIADPDDVDFDRASGVWRGDLTGVDGVEADWSLALVSGEYFFYVVDLSDIGGKFEITVETADAIEFTSDGLEDGLQGDFFDDPSFYSDEPFSDFSS